jgi:hypothetical protein
MRVIDVVVVAASIPHPRIAKTVLIRRTPRLEVVVVVVVAAVRGCHGADHPVQFG